jgi:hypothetical protein
MTNWMMRDSRSRGYKYPKWRLGQRRRQTGPGQGWADRPGPAGLGPSRPISRPPLLYVSSRVFKMFPPSACRSMSSVSLRIGHNSLSCKIQHFSGLVLGVCHLLGSNPWLLGVKFASLRDLYGDSRSCHKVLDELIPIVFLSTLKPCINTKLQNRHAHVNLLYHGG